jgi:hypothetical protein
MSNISNIEKFKKSKIYKIYSTLNTEEFYIGSTINRLCLRMAIHRLHYKNMLNNNPNNINGGRLTIYEIFNKYGVETCKIELIEEFESNNISEIRNKEAHYIKTLKGCINKNIPGRDAKQYRIDNADKIKQRAKEYYSRKKQEKKELIKNNI